MSFFSIAPSSIPDCEVRITCTDCSNGQRILYGKLWSRKLGMTLGKRCEYLYDPKICTKEFAIRAIVSRVEEAYKCSTASASMPNKAATTAPTAKGPFRRVFDEFKSNSMAKSTWGKSTIHSTYTYMEKNVLPVLDSMGTDISSADMDALKKKLVEKAAKNKRSYRSPDIAERSVSSYLQRINWILSQMCLYDPSLPLVQFDVDASSPVSVQEKEKSIPDAVRVILAWALLSLASNGLALGVAAMLLLGLRTAEACAVQIGSLRLREGWFVVCPVLYQMKNGERIPILKTKAAYRYTIGGPLMVRLIELRCQHLRLLGYSEDEIAQMPLVSASSDSTRYADPSDLSAYAKDLLLACGYEEERMRAAYLLMEIAPDSDGQGGKETEVTAYILRRDWLTRALHCCGMSAQDADYLIGHANDANQQTDYTNPDVQWELALQLERYVFLPDYTQNPYYVPIHVKPGRVKVTDIEKFNGCRVVAEDGPVEIQFDLTTDESGETFTLTTSGQLSVPVSHQYSRPDSPEKRRGRPLVRSLEPRSYYQTLIERAKEINLTRFSK